MAESADFVIFWSLSFDNGSVIHWPIPPKCLCTYLHLILWCTMMNLPVQNSHFQLSSKRYLSKSCNDKTTKQICFYNLHTYIRGFTKFGIKVAWRLQFLEYLRALSLKFQKARTKIEVVLALPCWLSQFSWDSQQGRARTTSILLVAFSHHSKMLKDGWAKIHSQFCF